MTLHLLKSGMATLRGTMPMLQHRAPEQVVERLRGGALTRLRKRLMARSGGLCECPECRDGYPIKLTLATMEADHIVALHRGGTNAFANYRALHVDCHARITAQQAVERASRTTHWSDDSVPPSPRARDDDMAC
jgi:5-methylcytosine-specific restriction endonuclease McrA